MRALGRTPTEILIEALVCAAHDGSVDLSGWGASQPYLALSGPNGTSVVESSGECKAWTSDGSTGQCYSVPSCNNKCNPVRGRHVDHPVRAVGLDGKCWCDTGFTWWRQSAKVDEVVDHEQDIYTENFAEAHCFAQQNGIKHIVMVGGDAMQCLLFRRDTSLYNWVHAGYKTYVVADVLQNTNRRMLNSFAYGVYAALGAKVIKMNSLQ